MKTLLHCVAALCAALTLQGTHVAAQTSLQRKNDTLRIMSYNVENFFHPNNDPLKNDEAFTPEGDNHWTMRRMQEKALRISRVIVSACGRNRPQIVGLCEMEGEAAAAALLHHGGLDNVGYNYICHPTPDARGVSTVLLYDERNVEVVSHRPIYVSIAAEQFFTRDVLYAKLKVDTDTFHVMVNHWPSKYGGETETIWKREHVATRVRQTCDSIVAAEPNANIVLLGDFNDQMESDVIQNTLGAHTSGTPLVILTADTKKQSYKYRGAWGTIDHVIVSSQLCQRFGRPIFDVADLPFLLTEDTRYDGTIPYRTYSGMRFLGGYSDHLPVTITIPLQ